jgi:PAS domain S-box-containing protein
VKTDEQSRAFSREAPRQPAPSVPRPVRLGALLLELEPWVPVTFHAGSFVVIEGGEDLGRLVGSTASATILGFLDAESGERLAGAVSRLGEVPCATAYVFSSGARPLEMLLVSGTEEVRAFFRNAENRLQTMDDLVFFYRAFLTGGAAVCFTNPNGVILDVNRAFLDLYGYDLGEVVGRTPRVLKSGRQPPATYDEMWKAITDPDGGFWSGETVNRRKDGSEVVVLLSINAVRRDDGALAGFVASAIDVSRRSQMQEELQAKNRELETFAGLASELMAITSHDLKAPLTAIVSRAGLLKSDLSRGETGSASQHIERIVDSTRRMADFIDNLLDLERIRSGTWQMKARRVRLDSILASCIEGVQELATGKGVTLRLEVSAAPDRVVADLVKMEQVFANLISNALKFSPPGSGVDVVYMDGPPGRKMVTVSDRGPGVPPEDLDRIFDRYYQVQKRGTGHQRGTGGVGLGLAIAKTVVEMHGGTIHAENRPEGGCRFVVEIPSRHRAASISELAVLVIDPLAAISDSIVPILRRKEVEVLTARSPVEVRRSYGLEKPDVVFIHGAGLSTELLDLIRELDQDGSPLVVDVDENSEGSRCAGCRNRRRRLVLPLLDVEVLGVLGSVTDPGPAGRV